VIHAKSAILEETHYYPFGLAIAPISSKAANGTENKYQYNGKEKQTKEFADGSGLEEYDYGSRFYDTQTGCWHNVDPSAEKYYMVSPYVYCINNPLLFVDPTGEEYIIHYRKDDIDITINVKSIEDIEKLKSIDDSFVQDVHKSFLYIKDNETFSNMLTSDKQVDVVSTNGTSRFEYEDKDFGQVIYYNSKEGVLLVNNSEVNKNMVEMKPNGAAISPATLLLHEIGHSVNYFFDPEKFKTESRQTNRLYDTKEEKNVVDEVENPFAKLKNEGVRTNHAGILFYTNDPTSNIKTAESPNYIRLKKQYETQKKIKEIQKKKKG
jgi:RHS repeat-associated protein